MRLLLPAGRPDEVTCGEMWGATGSIPGYETFGSGAVIDQVLHC
ncbi:MULTISPECIES: hypothetical protein [unclassified Nonomuraea]